MDIYVTAMFVRHGGIACARVRSTPRGVHRAIELAWCTAGIRPLGLDHLGVWSSPSRREQTNEGPAFESF